MTEQNIKTLAIVFGLFCGYLILEDYFQENKDVEPARPVRPMPLPSPEPHPDPKPEPKPCPGPGPCPRPRPHSIADVLVWPLDLHPQKVQVFTEDN